MAWLTDAGKFGKDGHFTPTGEPDRVDKGRALGPHARNDDRFVGPVQQITVARAPATQSRSRLTFRRQRNDTWLEQAVSPFGVR
jgi:hypothetical protein